MNRPFFSPSSRRDLHEILEYIALDKPGAALRQVERLEDACWMLAKNPMMGTVREPLAGQSSKGASDYHLASSQKSFSFSASISKIAFPTAKSLLESPIPDFSIARSIRP